MSHSGRGIGRLDFRARDCSHWGRVHRLNSECGGHVENLGKLPCSSGNAGGNRYANDLIRERIEGIRKVTTKESNCHSMRCEGVATDLLELFRNPPLSLEGPGPEGVVAKGR